MLRAITKSQSTLFPRIRYNYVPVSNYQIQNKINPIISVSLGTDKEPLFDIHIRLFQNVVPKTTENFKRLLLGTGSFNGRKLSLINNHFHNVVTRSYAELGHLEGGNCSIFGPTFRDESFELPHDRPGLLSSISQENTNNSRFLITFAPCSFLDLKNVVFGEVTAESFQHLKTLEKLSNQLKNYKILGAKLVEMKEQDHHEHH